MSLDILIKFGDHQHMESLLNDGVVYMKDIGFYRNQEQDAERYDPNEGIVRIMQMRDAKVKRKNPVSGELEEIFAIKKGVRRERNSILEKLNVFCMFHFVTPDDEEVHLGEIVSERVREGLGDSAIIIYDAADFISRVKQAALARGFKHMRRLVEYVDMSTRHDEVGPFVKDLKFSHQQELRIAVFDQNAPEPRPISLNIGNIKDIACMVPAQDVSELTIGWY